MVSDGKLDCSRQNITRSVNASLGGKKQIDFFQCAGQDPSVRIEDMVELVGRSSQIREDYGHRSKRGRRVLAGAFTTAFDLPGADPRKKLPRFQDEAMKQNIKLVNEAKALAARKGVAPAQIALGWILTLSGRPGMPTIIPIPGGSTSSKVTVV
ncbi:hypothetical protein ALT_3451 [Aspergillus lentulus]|uniref:NADP-dependent oxidoreductase domain-containing protein n=1 Tax=Aspergillus lentulus TaxID=293939 RepID=A0AAN4PKK2_ASPLE|nr:hypothetical protein ALT_3451 [Aspergillus lentulus]